ncbi:MAG TPA: hypothetical protein PLB26_06825 [Rubrivivax sp.]|nr:hypothetical protein [Rubrivivax sp.]
MLSARRRLPAFSKSPQESPAHDPPIQHHTNNDVLGPPQGATVDQCSALPITRIRRWRWASRATGGSTDADRRSAAEEGRDVSRKRCRRKAVAPLPPRGLRPRLLPDQVRDLAMAHVVNLDDIARGRAGAEVLWQTVGGVLCWLRVAEVLGRGLQEMQAQHDLMMRLVARHGATGRILFTGPEYQLARQGIVTMDLLAEIVDRPTAIAAAEWAEARVARMTAAAERACEAQTP